MGSFSTINLSLEIDPNGLCEKDRKVVGNLGNHGMEFQASNDVTEEDCSVKRHELCDNKNRSITYDFLISLYSCGIVAGFDESIRSESPRQVLGHLIRIGKGQGRVGRKLALFKNHFRTLP